MTIVSVKISLFLLQMRNLNKLYFLATVILELDFTINDLISSESITFHGFKLHILRLKVSQVVNTSVPSCKKIELHKVSSENKMIIYSTFIFYKQNRNIHH